MTAVSQAWRYSALHISFYLIITAILRNIYHQTPFIDEKTKNQSNLVTLIALPRFGKKLMSDRGGSLRLPAFMPSR